MTRSPVRLLGLDNEHISDFRTQDSRNGGLYRALDERLHVVGTTTPRLPLVGLRAIQAFHVVPGRARWRRRSGLSPMAFRAMTAAAGREVSKRVGEFDVVLQFYGLWAPGLPRPARPYAMYLDATLALTRREHRAAAPMTRRAERRWRGLEQAAYRDAAALFPMSDWVRRSLVDDYAVPPDKIVVVGAGANLVAPELPAPPTGGRVALFVGLDWQRKGGDVLLRAWPEVRRQIPAAELWIVGPPARPAAGDGVSWRGRLDRPALAALYEQANLFVMPSLFDPFPHVLREAMGHGLACVASRTGAVAEIARDGVDGLLVTPGDADELAQAMVALLGDRERSAALGRAGYRRTLTGATWDAVADRMAPRLIALAEA